MGPGKAWDCVKSGIIARAWITTSEDRIIGVDETSTRFYETMHRRFAENAPPTAVSMDGNYDQPPISSIHNHFATLSVDA